MIKYIHGSLLDSDCTCICHQVNCQGKMNSGVAKFIREKWPNVYDEYIQNYLEVYDLISCAIGKTGAAEATAKALLKNVQLIPINDNQFVVNMFAQENYGYDGERYTSYDAFYDCLLSLREMTSATTTYAFPRKIGSDRGGANWNVIRTMINEVLGDREVYIYTLDGEED